MLAKDLRMGTWIQQAGRIGAHAGGSQVLQGGDDDDYVNGDDGDDDDDDYGDGGDGAGDGITLLKWKLSCRQKTAIMTLAVAT